MTAEEIAQQTFLEKRKEAQRDALQISRDIDYPVRYHNIYLNPDLDVTSAPLSSLSLSLYPFVFHSVSLSLSLFFTLLPGLCVRYAVLDPYGTSLAEVHNISPDCMLVEQVRYGAHLTVQCSAHSS